MKKRSRRYAPHTRMYAIVAGCLALAALVVAAAYILPSSGSYLSAAVVQSQIISLTDAARIQNGGKVLSESAALDAAAQAKADDMAAKGYFSHVGPDGKTPWAWIDESGYVYKYAGENLAVRFTESSDVVNAWMASPSHRENIVAPQYTQIGVGVADGSFEGAPATYIVQYFGAPGGPVGSSTLPAYTPATSTSVQGAAVATGESGTIDPEAASI